MLDLAVSDGKALSGSTSKELGVNAEQLGKIKANQQGRVALRGANLC
jgi:hypothetical protein